MRTLENRIISVSEAAKQLGITRQGIYTAIKNKRLKATLKYGSWFLTINDLEEYITTKYTRNKTVFKGKLVYDKERGYYSPNEVAEMFKVPAQQVYYAVRVGIIRAKKKGSCIVISQTEIDRYSIYISKKKGLKTA